MQLELEVGGDTEIAATSAHTPVKIGVFVRVGAHKLPVRGDQLDAADIVQGESVAAGEPAESAAERETADARVGDRTRGRYQAELHRVVIHVAEQAAARDLRYAPLRIDTNAAEQAQVYHHSAVAGRFAGRTVASAFDGNQEARLPRKIDGVSDVRYTLRLDDQCGVLVYRRVQYPPRVVIRSMAGKKQVASQAVGQFLHRRLLQYHLGAVACNRIHIGIDRIRCRQQCRRQTLVRHRRGYRCRDGRTDKFPSIHCSPHVFSCTAIDWSFCVSIVQG